ncbi:MAG: hypothetical protein QXS20_10120 [Candidatus Thorarchaeota archaeon]
MGVATKLLGVILMGLGTVTFLMGMNIEPPLSILWIVLGLFSLSMGLGLINANRIQPKAKSAPPTITEVRCDNRSCDFKEIRDFLSGDYVLKPVDQPCPKCGARMTVYGVYVVREEEEKPSI